MKDTLEKIYDDYHQDLYNFIFYMVKNKQTTEDLVQEVYIRIFRSYYKFRGESNEKTWIFSIARHVTIDYFRSQTRRRKRISEFFDWNKKGDFIPDENLLPEDIVIKNEHVKQIYKLLDRCTIDQRSVLILRFLQSFSIKETADALQFSISKVKTTQHRALKMLRQSMPNDNSGGGNSDVVQ